MHMHYLIYPRERFIDDQEIIQWAKDILSTPEYIFSEELSVEEAISILQDEGVATFSYKVFSDGTDYDLQED